MTNSIIFNGHKITDFTMDETGRFEVPANYYPPTIADAIKQLQDIGFVMAFNSTSPNDLTDSVQINGKKDTIRIHFPNASETDFENEQFGTFEFFTFEDGNDIDFGDHFNSFDECLEYLKSNFIFFKGSLIGKM